MKILQILIKYIGIYFLCNITINMLGIIFTCTNYALINLLGTFFTLLFFWRIYKFNDENFFESCKFKIIPRNYIILLIFIAILLSYILTTIIDIFSHTQFGFQYHRKFENIKLNYTGILWAINICFIGPIFEEILFRGIILNKIKKYMNISLAIIIQATIFALLHMNILQSIDSIIFAIILGIVYVYTESIISTIIVHTIVNIIGNYSLLHTNLNFVIFAISIIILVILILILRKVCKRNLLNLI